MTEINKVKQTHGLLCGEISFRKHYKCVTCAESGRKRHQKYTKMEALNKSRHEWTNVGNKRIILYPPLQTNCNQVPFLCERAQALERGRKSRSHFYAKIFQKVNLVKEIWLELRTMAAKRTHNHSLSNSLINKIKNFTLPKKNRIREHTEQPLNIHRISQADQFDKITQSLTCE